MAAESELKNHVIVCGYGLVGEMIVDTLLQHDVRFVVIEQEKSRVEQLRGMGVTAIQGDATSSKVLKSAGIMRAKAIAVVMGDDAKNLFCMVTAKSLNPKIAVATRATDTFMKEKLKDAGASFIATPNQSVSDELFAEISKGLG